MGARRADPQGFGRTCRVRMPSARTGGGLESRPDHYQSSLSTPQKEVDPPSTRSTGRCGMTIRPRLRRGSAVRAVEAGHILGSASLEVTVEEGGPEEHRGVLRRHRPARRAATSHPVPFKHADLVFMESTYGDKEHPVAGANRGRGTRCGEGKRSSAAWPVSDYMYHRPIAAAALSAGGCLQSARRWTPFPIFLDSPMAIPRDRQSTGRMPELFDERGDRDAAVRRSLDPTSGTVEDLPEGRGLDERSRRKSRGRGGASPAPACALSRNYRRADQGRRRHGPLSRRLRPQGPRTQGRDRLKGKIKGCDAG